MHLAPGSACAVAALLLAVACQAPGPEAPRSPSSVDPATAPAVPARVGADDDACGSVSVEAPGVPGYFRAWFKPALYDRVAAQPIVARKEWFSDYKQCLALTFGAELTATELAEAVTAEGFVRRVVDGRDVFVHPELTSELSWSALGDEVSLLVCHSGSTTCARRRSAVPRDHIAALVPELAAVRPILAGYERRWVSSATQSPYLQVHVDLPCRPGADPGVDCEGLTRSHDATRSELAGDATELRWSLGGDRDITVHVYRGSRGELDRLVAYLTELREN